MALKKEKRVKEIKKKPSSRKLKKGAQESKNVRITISIDPSLLAQITALAREKNILRNQFVVNIIEEFLRKQETHEELEKINAAYADEPDEEEKELLRRMRKSHRRLVEGQW